MIKKYLKDHSLDPTHVKKLGWMWKEGSSTITIPVYDDKGQLLFSRYRHLEGQAKFSQDAGTHPALYCSHKIKKYTEVTFCEGEPDAARLWQEGIPAITGTSGVKTFSEALAAPLKGKEVTICLDNDEAGKSSIEQYYKILTEAGAVAKIKQLPEPFKDISDYFTAGYSKEDFEKLPTVSIDDWYDLNIPEEFKLETIKDILSQDIPPEEWLVNRILPAEGFAFIVGAEATGKSFYTLTLAKAVATGRPWLEETAVDDDGKPLFAVPSKENVLIIDKENTKRRVQSRARWMGVNTDNIFYLKYPHYFELSDPNEEDGFSKIVKEAARQVKKHNIKFIIIDSFTDVMVGNENAASDVQGFFDAMRRLFPGTSGCVLHHASKPAQGVTRTSAQRARGSTNIMAQVYSAFYVESVLKSKTEFILEQTKAGDAEKLSRFYVELDVQPIANGNGKTKVVGIKYKGIVPDEEMKTNAAISAIEEIFKSKDIVSRKEMLELLQADGISQRTALRAIKQMKTDKIIDSVPDEKNKAKRNYILLDQKSDVYED
jgi:hypothetical protein